MNTAGRGHVGMCESRTAQGHESRETNCEMGQASMSGKAKDSASAPTTHHPLSCPYKS